MDDRFSSTCTKGIQMVFRSLILCLLTVNQFSHAAMAAEKTAIRFSSVYTDLALKCVDKFDSVGEGQDMPLVCKGQGNYSVHVGFSACCDHVLVEGKKGFRLQLPAQTFGSTLNRDLEWRLANGKPFAIIFRIDRYKDDITMPPVKKTGSTLS